MEGETSVPLVSAEIGKQWAGLSDDEKAQYKQQAAAALEEHLKLYPKAEKTAKKRGKMSGYNLFVSENLSKQDTELSSKERISACAAAWREVSDEVKGEYNSRAAALWEEASTV